MSADSLSMTIPLTNLRDLPQGASYTQRKGRAQVTIRTLHDTLYLDASCDSLQQLVTYYQQRSNSYQRTAARNAPAGRADPCRAITKRSNAHQPRGG